MNEQLAKAFDFAQEVTKQLLALATGIIALGITFTKDMAPSGAAGARDWLFASWLLLLLSVFFGLMTLMALAGELEPVVSAAAKDASTTRVPSTRRSNVTWPAIAQVLLFFAGLALTVTYGYKAIK